jgi:hypothetical protein
MLLLPAEQCEWVFTYREGFLRLRAAKAQKCTSQMIRESEMADRAARHPDSILGDGVGQGIRTAGRRKRSKAM